MIDPKELKHLQRRLARGSIRALSIKQPYPHHIFYNGKDVENRNWATSRRGWIAVHAGISKTDLDMTDPREAAMPRGGIVGMTRIVDCIEQMDSPWFYGKFGFVLRDAFAFPMIPCKGALGFFTLDPGVCRQIITAIDAMEFAT